MNVTTPIRAVPIGSVTIQGKKFDVATHPEFVKFFEALTNRVGGPTGPGTVDLAVSQFEDAGIAEQQAEFYTFKDAVTQDTSLAALREELIALRARVETLEQGMSL
jgi:hypothetical protein